jgi:hypothetical protein
MLKGLGGSNPSVIYEMFNDSSQIRGRERGEMI